MAEKSSKILYPNRVFTVGRPDYFRVSHRAVALRSVSFHLLRYRGVARVDFGRLDHFFLVAIPLRGQVLVRVGERQVHANREVAAVVSPGASLSMTPSGACAVFIVKIRRHVLEGYSACREYAPTAGSLLFEPGMAVTNGPARQWWEIVRCLAEGLDRDDSLLRNPVVVKPAENLLMAALLQAQPNNHARALEPPGDHSATFIREVVDKLETAPEVPRSVVELADQAGVSLRTLQERFRRHLKTSPSRYLTDIRLRRAREDLLSAGPGSRATVTDIAQRYDFSHLSRFSHLYRDRFGETPSDTRSRAHRDHGD
ncbi:MAG TPA: AraC family transcriptional regulator [Amycolatopsis sp.]|nr:AraC family transcriptional regulator [Amycolatopsis sp.]